MSHLHWLIPSGLSSEIVALKRSTLASVRLRCVPSILSVCDMNWKVTCGEHVTSMPSVLLIGKIGANNIEVRQALWLEQIKGAKKSAKIFLDYTDHHLGFNSPMSSFYESAMKEVDCCITPSKSMAELLSKRWSGPISIIEDPLEINACQPKIRVGKPITLLWFGHSSNIDFLIHFLSDGFRVGDYIRLIVLSNENGLNHFANSNLISNAKIEFNLGLWSLESMVEAAKISDACIIPSDLKNNKKIGASSNRLITSLALGLPTAADNLPSYREFSNYYCDLRSTGFREILSDPVKFASVVAGAQHTFIDRFNVRKIQQDWKNLLLSFS